MSSKKNEIDPLKSKTYFCKEDLVDMHFKHIFHANQSDHEERLYNTCQWLFEVVERYDDEMSKLLPLLDEDQQRAIGIEPEKIKEISDKVFEQLKNKISKGL